MTKPPVKGLYYGLTFFVGMIMAGISLDMMLSTSHIPIYLVSMLMSLFVCLSSLYYMIFEFDIFPIKQAKKDKP